LFSDGRRGVDSHHMATLLRPSALRPGGSVPVSVDVQMHAGRIVTFDEFRRLHAAPAIALDGYVDSPPRWDVAGPWGNLDHHAGVERLATPATCQQVALAIRAGLWDWMPGRRATVHLNDCDADASLSVWLLRHPGLVADPSVDALVRAEGCLDASGGCGAECVGPDLLEILAWVFEPYHQWRHDPWVDTGDEAQLAVVEAVGERLDLFAGGLAGRSSTASSYDVLHHTAHVVAVEERGAYARSGLQRDGWRCFVSSRFHGGRVVLSVGCTDPNVPVDLHEVWRDLNLAEGLDPDRGDRWGGSDLIGGSPRRAGTRLSVEEVCEVVEARWGRPSASAPA
jgi:hypothetical protein